MKQLPRITLTRVAVPRYFYLLLCAFASLRESRAEKTRLFTSSCKCSTVACFDSAGCLDNRIHT